jgi:hypothetical protein
MHAVVPWALAQAVPQAPQWAASVWRSIRHPALGAPPQTAYGEVHVGEHVPDEQVVVPLGLVHAAPQAPQLVTVEPRSVSQPLVGSPSQSPKPTPQAGTQTPLGQLVDPWALAQLVPQLPQWATVAREDSQPVATVPLQLPNPALHVSTQPPETQTGVALTVLHASPQTLQFLMSMPRFDSQPVDTRPSQSP